MTDPVKAFMATLSGPKPRIRVQNFNHIAGREAGLGLAVGWWVRVSEEGREESPSALLIGPFDTVEESRIAMGATMEALGLVPVTMNGQPIKETNA